VTFVVVFIETVRDRLRLRDARIAQTKLTVSSRVRGEHTAGVQTL